MPNVRGKKVMVSYLIVGGISLVVLILIDTFITGIGKFTYNTVRCGRVPVVIEPGSDFASGYRPSYIVPGDRYYKFSAASNFLCTEQEAKARNISIDPFTEEGNRRTKEQNK